MSATEGRIDITRWTIRLGESSQTITSPDGVGPFVIKRRAYDWTKWGNHKWEKNGRDIFIEFESLEEATKYAVDLASADEKYRTAKVELDVLTGRMRLS